MIKTKGLVLAKVETTYALDAAPTNILNAILCEVPEVSVIGRGLERTNMLATYGARRKVNIGDGVKVVFSTELKGSGTAGTAPEIGPLFRACNFTETIAAGASVSYDPNSLQSTAESITIWVYIDGICHKVTGCRGTFDMELKAGEYGKIKWEFTGLYQGPVDLALATGTFNQTIPARFLSAQFALDSYAGIIENCKISIGNEITKRVSANAITGILEYFIKQRNVTGNVDPEMVLVATKDFWTLWSGSSAVAFTARVGSTAGNICTITGPRVQLSEALKYGDRENILTLDMPIIFTPNTGNDEIKFMFT